VDAALARLLAKKRQVRERIELPAGAQPAAIEALRAARESRQAAALAEEELTRGMAIGEKREPKRAATTTAAPSAAKADDTATPYTQRLLQAKRRAKKK
jgi:hypothetical protein